MISYTAQKWMKHKKCDWTKFWYTSKQIPSILPILLFKSAEDSPEEFLVLAWIMQQLKERNGCVRTEKQCSICWKMCISNGYDLWIIKKHQQISLLMLWPVTHSCHFSFCWIHLFYKNVSVSILSILSENKSLRRLPSRLPKY